MAVEIKNVSPVPPPPPCNVYVYVFMCASMRARARVCMLVLKCQTGEGQETVDAREWHMNTKRFTGKREIQNYNLYIYIMSMQSHMR